MAEVRHPWVFAAIGPYQCSGCMGKQYTSRRPAYKHEETCSFVATARRNQAGLELLREDILSADTAHRRAINATRRAVRTAG
jgi:hypothetical protein